jgi:phosphoenolpyruvate carboxykinase (ATP)
MNSDELRSRHGLEELGLRNLNEQYWNLTTGALYEHVVRRREGQISHLGPLVVRTGHYTGRAAKDKFVVREPSSQDNVWWGKVNQPFEEQQFSHLFDRFRAFLQGRDVFVQDCVAGADPQYAVPIRVITANGWHSLFARTLFRIIPRESLHEHRPQFTVIHSPMFHAAPEIDGTNSEAFILLHFAKGLILIGGTGYAGEIKKSIFTVMNYLLPLKSVLSMHCSANIGPGGDIALFFGLSGTGKTTLSADPKRRLIGDDEHGWSDNGVFNFEGGCYAKVIRLSKESEPEIFNACHRFGTILENVGFDNWSRRVDLDDDSLTENTRGAYSLTQIPNHEPSGRGDHPKNVFFLTCDAFGVMPPIARLTPEQAMYHFISGYTAKVAGTEAGAGDEPTAAFSACYGAPFMVHHPFKYAQLLSQKVSQHGVNCWLVNTGWTGGPYGTGKRMSIKHTRALLNAALEGKLESVETRADPVFGVRVPVTCDGVPAEVLDPKKTWKDGKAYDAKARELAGRFRENFKAFEGEVSEEVRAAAPRA